MDENKPRVVNNTVTPLTEQPIFYEHIPTVMPELPPEDIDQRNFMDPSTWLLTAPDKNVWRITKYHFSRTSNVIITPLPTGGVYVETTGHGTPYATIDLYAFTAWSKYHLSWLISIGTMFDLKYRDIVAKGYIDGEVEWESVVGDGDHFVAKDVKLIYS